MKDLKSLNIVHGDMIFSNLMIDQQENLRLVDYGDAYFIKDNKPHYEDDFNGALAVVPLDDLLTGYRFYPNDMWAAGLFFF